MAAYPYLAASLLLLFAFSTSLVFLPRHARAARISAFCSTPLAFASVVFVPEYWRPVRITTLPAGPEDLLFSFATGGLAWLAAAYVGGLETSHAITARSTLRRFGFALGVLVVVWSIPYAYGIGAMPSFFLLCLGHLRLLWCLEAPARRACLRGGLCFAALYLGFAASLLWIWPHFLEQWTHENLLGFRVLGVPVEELGWALAFGVFWTALMVYVLDARAEPSPARAVSTRTDERVPSPPRLEP